MSGVEPTNVVSLCDRRRVRDEMRAIRHQIGDTFVVEGVRFEVTITNSTIDGVSVVTPADGGSAPCDGHA